MAISAKSKYILLSILLILASINFTRTAYDILKSSKRLDDLEDDVSQLDAKKHRLESEISKKKTPEYVEEKARNELNMIKPGEKIVVFVGNKKESSATPIFTESSTNVLSATSKKPEKKSSNPVLWYKLFF